MVVDLLTELQFSVINSVVTLKGLSLCLVKVSSNDENSAGC